MSTEQMTNSIDESFEMMVSTPADTDSHHLVGWDATGDWGVATGDPALGASRRQTKPTVASNRSCLEQPSGIGFLPEPASHGAPRRTLANALKRLHFSSPDHLIVDRETASPNIDSQVAFDDNSVAEKRRIPRSPGDARVSVAIVPQHQKRLESEQHWNFISTPIRGSVLFLNVNGASFSLNAPVSQNSDVVLQMTHPTFRQSCTISARVLRSEQIGTLWHAACAFHQPISHELMNAFCQLVQPRLTGDHSF
jgi:hypothetical protein